MTAFVIVGDLFWRVESGDTAVMLLCYIRPGACAILSVAVSESLR